MLLSILDLAFVPEGGTPADALRNTRDLAQHAEKWGYRRFWLAEHHNIVGIASGATAVVIGYVAANTRTIRVGAGGIMLPNHLPLVIAEQFGTLETLYPGRIDLGLGRAPGSDTAAMRALRRDEFSSERFPQDVQELQGLLSDNSPISGVIAIPGKGTHVPLYILGSSLFGAQLAAPYAIAGVGVIAAPDKENAEAQLEITRRARVKNLFKSPSGGKLNDREVDEVLSSYRAKVVDEMMTYTAVGTGEEAAAYLADFQEKTGAQELITVHYADSVDNRVTSIELLAEAASLSERAEAAAA